MIEAVEVGVQAVELYLWFGLAFAVGFVLFGASRIDPGAREGSLGFRLIVIPGVALLWPLLAWRLARGHGLPVERNAHRRCAVAEIAARRAAGRNGPCSARAGVRSWGSSSCSRRRSQRSSAPESSSAPTSLRSRIRSAPSGLPRDSPHRRGSR